MTTTDPTNPREVWPTRWLLDLDGRVALLALVAAEALDEITAAMEDLPTFRRDHGSVLRELGMVADMMETSRVNELSADYRSAYYGLEAETGPVSA